MITLTSKQSHQIKFPGSKETVSHILPVLTVTVETGVAVFTLIGTNPHDWTRDTLSFPVGAPCAAAEFASGIASACPVSFWTPLNKEDNTGEISFTAPVTVNGSTDDGHSVTAFGDVHISIPGSAVPPPLGLAVDSALVSYSAQAGQPILQMALAVFGTCTAFLRVSYTAYIVNSHGGIVVTGGGTTAKE
jgi:hypothetical protein